MHAVITMHKIIDDSALALHMRYRCLHYFAHCAAIRHGHIIQINGLKQSQVVLTRLLNLPTCH
jgi:hypothetical protein